jgi:hypothetical protein
MYFNADKYFQYRCSLKISQVKNAFNAPNLQTCLLSNTLHCRVSVACPGVCIPDSEMWLSATAQHEAT